MKCSCACVIMSLYGSKLCCASIGAVCALYVESVTMRIAFFCIFAILSMLLLDVMLVIVVQYVRCEWINA